MATITPEDRNLWDRLRDIIATGSEREALEALAEHREGGARLMGDNQTCLHCRFRDNDRETHYEGFAACRRFPPQNKHNDGLQMVWPMVGRFGWCGEWQPRILGEPEAA